MKLKKYRADLTPIEFTQMKERIGLKLKNGGLGVLLVRNTAKAAFVGTWCSIADDVTNFCMKKGIIVPGYTAQEDADNLDLFCRLPTIVDIIDEASHLQDQLDPFTFNERQINDIGLVKGKLSISDYLCNVAGNNAGIIDEDGKLWKKNLGIMRDAKKMQSRIARGQLGRCKQITRFIHGR